MKWSIIQLQKFRNEAFSIDETIELKELPERDSEIRDVSPVHVTGRADISSSKITFHLHIEAVLTLPCARTLVDVPYPVSIDTTETFLLNPSHMEEGLEEEIHLLDSEVVNLEPIIEEILILQVPLQVFSDKAMEDEGMLNGKGWEVVSEEELERERETEQNEQPKTDPRLADLAKFFDENKNT
ncbi:YceD family protein [Jeotgalibacillus campisalis]|uniref:Protein-N-phosphohistidine-sugar phosphotransferase n=1 Tax=Jeotgalibacillus campisalis TaxID=220754 RepID=A0A0C2RBC4_9BACL|nr:YceD family protein [Jeotgalibacillus campisalis]KIL47610.1 protein-N-phosphohistidine-sugar phosphotransferase [Jeotgalibacillus campisalis]